MKKYNKWIFNVASGLALTSVIATSCVDEIKFGNSFLEKAPGGSVTKDTVFNNAEYTRQFLTNLYGMQYYGLPYKNVANQESSNQYVGKPEALTDLYVFTYPSCGISGPYYKGTHTANYGKRSDKFDYLRNNVWEAVRGVWMLIENIDNVPGLGEDEKASMVAQAKCILASRYFDVFRHYGGIPLIKGTFSGTDTSYEMPRNSVEETVNYMVQLLDEAAAVLPWTVETPASESGRWTRAAALAYKCRILQFAASPLFNSDQLITRERQAILLFGMVVINRNYGIAVWKRVNNSLMNWLLKVDIVYSRRKVLVQKIIVWHIVQAMLIWIARKY